MLVDWCKARTISATLGHAASLPEHTHGKLTIEMLNQLPVNHSLASLYSRRIKKASAAMATISSGTLDLAPSRQIVLQGLMDIGQYVSC